MPADKARPPKPTIGFLAATIDDPYQYAVWTGAVEEATRLGLTLVFHGGHRLGSPVGYEALDNIAFDLAGNSKPSGLIILSNVISTFATMEEVVAFVARFGALPIVSAGMGVPGLPCVSIHNEGGMRQVTEHLALVHGRRRFLFLAGPRGHEESETRKREFAACLAALGPGFPEARIEHCDFQEGLARLRVAAYLESGGKFDAVVAANDRMAFGAMRVIREFGLEVPRDVSVTGFDDTEESRFTVPPLTTVHQPTPELGRRAVRYVAAELGLAAYPATRPRVSFIIRESCGCPNPAAQAASKREQGGRKARELSERQALIALSRRVNRLLLQGKNPAPLRLHAAYSPLRERALLIISEGESRYQAQRLLTAGRNAEILRAIEGSLVSSFALEDILEGVARGARALGISACWLALFDSPGSPPAWARLILASRGDQTAILAPKGTRFRTAELLPDGLPPDWPAYVFEPLRFGRELLGYLICTADADDCRVYQALRDQVSSALKGAALMAAERDRERRLEREVRARTRELAASNVQLREEMAERRTLEREIIGLSNRIMEKIGMDIHDNLCQDIAGMGVLAARMEYALKRRDDEEAGTAAAIARMASETAAKAKGMARGLYPAELGENGVLGAVKRLVQAAAARSAAAVSLEADEGFDVRDGEKAVNLYRIVQEALNNALRHSGADAIAVRLRRDGAHVVAEVDDDGEGMGERREDEAGMGLRILSYRAGITGAVLKISDKGGRGTLVSCRMEA